MKHGFQAHTTDVLNDKEELVLRCVKGLWERSKPEKPSIENIKEQFAKDYGYELSHEKIRQIVYELFKKGEILIDIKGRERLCRPNHVTVYSRSRPKDFRNITIWDTETELPISRIWVSTYDKDGKPYLALSESKRTPQGWQTVNNIMITPEAVSSFFEMIRYIKTQVRKESNGK